jgi:hypothetical protein
MKKFALLTVAVFLSLNFSLAMAIKPKFDKITGLTEYKTREFVASTGIWSGNYITYSLLTVQAEKEKIVKTFFNLSGRSSLPLLDSEAPLYLLIDNKERLKLLPFKSKSYEPGGTGIYWGAGISTYKKTVFQFASYEIELPILEKIQNAKRIDCSIVGKRFAIKGFKIKQFKQVANMALKNNTGNFKEVN